MNLIKRDPYSIVLSLIMQLNLLRENHEYNINNFKDLRSIELHWSTIQKYFKIGILIKNYFPKIQLSDSKFLINSAPLYELLNEKEKFIIYLFNNKALNIDNAVDFPEVFNAQMISESISFLYMKTEDNKYYLISSGFDVYKSILRKFSNIIYNNLEDKAHLKMKKEINLEKFQRVIKIYDKKIIYEKMKSIQISGQLLEIVI